MRHFAFTSLVSEMHGRKFQDGRRAEGQLALDSRGWQLRASRIDQGHETFPSGELQRERSFLQRHASPEFAPRSSLILITELHNQHWVVFSRNAIPKLRKLRRRSPIHIEDT